MTLMNVMIRAFDVPGMSAASKFIVVVSVVPVGHARSAGVADDALSNITLSPQLAQRLPLTAAAIPSDGERDLMNTPSTAYLIVAPQLDRARAAAGRTNVKWYRSASNTFTQTFKPETAINRKNRCKP